MNKKLEGLLCLHGAIVMFAAFVSGMCIGLVAMGQMSGAVEDWKLAHMETLINSIVLLAVAGVLGKLRITERGARIATYCLIAMAYCNSVFGYMRGATGALGYQFDASIANNIATFAGMLGVPLAVIAFSIILMGAWRTVRSS